MAKPPKQSANLPICRSCGGPTVAVAREHAICTFCAQQFDLGRFEAHGAEAMAAQVEILKEHNRNRTIQSVAGYAASVGFAAISAVLILFAPADRVIAADLVAAAFLALAVGLAGFTRFKAKAPGVEMSADRPRSN